MGQAYKPTALVAEDDELQRALVSTLLEESNFKVIECESAEAAMLVLDRSGESLDLIFTDVNLAGMMDGTELAKTAKLRFPNLTIIVTSGVQSPVLPDNIKFMPKPWRALDLLREAARAVH